jgi:hypothetical protein
MFQAAKRLGVCNAVTVHLKGQPDVFHFFLFADLPPRGIFIERGIRRKNPFLTYLQLLFDRFSDYRYKGHCPSLVALSFLAGAVPAPQISNQFHLLLTTIGLPFQHFERGYRYNPLLVPLAIDFHPQSPKIFVWFCLADNDILLMREATSTAEVGRKSCIEIMLAT